MRITGKGGAETREPKGVGGAERQEPDEFEHIGDAYPYMNQFEHIGDAYPYMNLNQYNIDNDLSATAFATNKDAPADSHANVQTPTTTLPLPLPRLITNSM